MPCLQYLTRQWSSTDPFPCPRQKGSLDSGSKRRNLTIIACALINFDSLYFFLEAINGWRRSNFLWETAAKTWGSPRERAVIVPLRFGRRHDQDLGLIITGQREKSATRRPFGQEIGSVVPCQSKYRQIVHVVRIIANYASCAIYRKQ